AGWPPNTNGKFGSTCAQNARTASRRFTTLAVNVYSFRRFGLGSLADRNTGAIIEWTIEARRSDRGTGAAAACERSADASTVRWGCRAVYRRAGLRASCLQSLSLQPASARRW